jgi:hypothetical protein
VQRDRPITSFFFFFFLLRSFFIVRVVTKSIRSVYGRYVYNS